MRLPARQLRRPGEPLLPEDVKSVREVDDTVREVDANVRELDDTVRDVSTRKLRSH